MRRAVRFGENRREVERGISFGCPLSPLMGALYLKPLDDAMGNLDVYYARFMNDRIIAAPLRWKLKKAVVVANRILDALKVKKHIDKTFIGKACRGFDFLGFHFFPGGIEELGTGKKCFLER